MDVASGFLDTFANRTDRWGCYGAAGIPLTGGGKDNPDPNARGPLDVAAIERHLKGEQVLGVHAIGLDNRCKWGCFDLDAHAKDDSDRHADALSLEDELRQLGVIPVVEKSSRGAHAWIFFSEPVPAARLHAWGKATIGRLGLKDVDFYPTSGAHDKTPKRCGGGWIRLPGKHHSRDEWSEAWDPVGFGFTEWANGADVIFADPPKSGWPSDLPDVAPERSDNGTVVPPVPDYIADGAEGQGVPYDSTLDELPGVVAQLSPKRAERYEDPQLEGSWFRVGAAIYGTRADAEGLRIFEQFSRRAPDKYSPGACVKQWDKYKQAGVKFGFGSLVHWMREDQGETFDVDPAPVKPGDTGGPKQRPTPHLDDLGQRDDTIHAYQDKVRYDEERVSYLFRGHYWRPESGPPINGMASRAARQRQKWALGKCKEADKGKKALFVAFAKRAVTSDGLNSALANAARDPRVAIKRDEFNTATTLLGVKNGVVDLVTGQLRDGKPQDFISQQAAVPFDPAATCPRFLREMAEWFEDKELRAWILRFMGYALLGAVPERKAVVFVGPRRNGKSVLTQALCEVFGDYGTNTNWNAFTARRDTEKNPELTRCRDARLVTASEARSGGSFESATFKQYVGGDVVTTRTLHKDIVAFRAKGTVFLATNFLPRTPCQDVAVYDRLVIAPMLKEFGGDSDLVDDKGLANALREEYGGILTLLIKECAEYLREGIPPIPTVCAKALQDYVTSDDPLHLFTEAFTMEPDRGAWVGAMAFYRAYVRFEKDVLGKARVGLTAPKFQLAAERRWPEFEKRSRVKYYFVAGRQWQGDMDAEWNGKYQDAQQLFNFFLFPGLESANA